MVHAQPDELQPDEHRPGTAWTVVRLAAIVVPVALILSIAFFQPPGFPPEDFEEFVEEMQPLSAVIVAVGGLRQPPVVPAEQAGLSDRDQIIGVCVNGRCRAYSIAGLASLPSRIVNDVIGERAISVIYDDRGNRVRVVRRHQPGAPLDLELGGVIDGELQILFDGVRYPQTSKHLPFADHPFERTTWSEWKSAHPSTDAFVSDE